MRPSLSPPSSQPSRQPSRSSQPSQPSAKRRTEVDALILSGKLKEAAVLINEMKAGYEKALFTAKFHLIGGNLEEAYRAAKRALQLAKTEEEKDLAKRFIGMTLFEMSNGERAESYFEDIAEKTVDDLFFIIIIEMQRGNVRKARDLLKKAEQLNTTRVRQLIPFLNNILIRNNPNLTEQEKKALYRMSMERWGRM